MIREIVQIDEDLCDGCGLCVPNCEEGALRIVDGKARLVSDRLCDGMGACLGHCPRGAIKIIHRDADAFDEAAVAEHLRGSRHAGPQMHPASSPSHLGSPHSRHAIPQGSLAQHPAGAAPQPAAHGGCPGSRFASFAAPSLLGRSNPSAGGAAELPSALTHWPVQLRLLPTAAPVLQNAKLLVSADCVPFACASFHRDLLPGHAVAIACPKLDNTQGYVEKLAEMIARNGISEITVAHMEVPCCLGLYYMVLQAVELSGVPVTVTSVIVSTRGEILSRRSIQPDAGGRFDLQ